MMRKPEQRLWDRMRNNVPREVRLERIENVVSVGIPDVLSLHAGRVAFVELKAALAPPARATTRLLPVGKGLSVEQRNWHLEWARAGGESFVLIGCGSKWLALIEGRNADLINAAPQADLEFVRVASDWPGITKTLKGKT